MLYSEVMYDPSGLVGIGVTITIIYVLLNVTRGLLQVTLPLIGFRDWEELDRDVRRAALEVEQDKQMDAGERRAGRLGLQDVVYIKSDERDIKSSSKPKFLVYTISGNPGLIEYYREFMREISSLLGQRSLDVSVDLYGRSLQGFEVAGQSAPPHQSLDLPQQIDAVEQDLAKVVAATAAEQPKIILMGHSVGSYIALEILARHRSRLEKQQASKQEPNIVGSICLFPTVVDIGLSPSGKRLTALSRIPFFPIIVSWIAAILPALLPYSLLSKLVAFVTRMPSLAAEVTTQFLSSRHGVRSALYLGRSEMQLITADRWSDEVWGAAHTSPTGVDRAKLFFLFGEEDHWVADSTRDELMRLRGREIETGADWKPYMEIDTTGIPHGFVIDHWKPVATKCAEYIEKIVSLTNAKRM